MQSYWRDGRTVGRDELAVKTVPVKLSEREVAWLDERIELGSRETSEGPDYWGKPRKLSRSGYLRKLVRDAMEREATKPTEPEPKKPKPKKAK
jgi:hypothetical protein